MVYTPSDKILKNYADVLINFALGGGKGIKKGEVVRVSASESAKPLFIAVCNAIVDAGGHVMSNYGPDEEQGDKRRNISVSRYFYEHANEAQIKHFPAKYLKGIIEEMDHSVFLLAEKDPHALKGMAANVAARSLSEVCHELEQEAASGDLTHAAAHLARATELERLTAEAVRAHLQA